MEMTTFPIEEYRGVKIYFQQFGRNFVLMFPWRGEIHQEVIAIRPTFSGRFNKILGLTNFSYSPAELDGIRKYFFKKAMETVDKLYARKRQQSQIRRKNLAGYCHPLRLRQTICRR